MDEAGDWLLLSAAAAAAIPFVFANAVIFHYRKRRYFQAHGGVGLILAGSTAGLIWIVSDFVTNGHFARRSGLLAKCVLWAFWLKITCGLCLWLICITMRLHRMEEILNGGSQSSWSRKILWISLFMLPTILMSAAATLGHPQRNKGVCKFKTKWLLARYFAIPPVYFCGVLVFLFRLRKQNDLLVRSEFVHTCDYCIMTFLVYILTGVTYLTDGYHHVEGRCFLTFCVCCLVFFHFWVRMAWPVYLCLFKPEHAMDDYEEELKHSGASIFNAFIAASGHLNIPSSELAILQAMHEAAEEVAELKDQIDKLETKKVKLENEIRLLRQRPNPKQIEAGDVNVMEIELQN